VYYSKTNGIYTIKIFFA